MKELLEFEIADLQRKVNCPILKDKPKEVRGCVVCVCVEYVCGTCSFNVQT